MSSLPSVDGKTAIKAFQSAGFSVVRIKGSHHLMEKDGHRQKLSIPVHGNKTIRAGTLRSQIKAAGLTVDEFVAILQ